VQGTWTDCNEGFDPTRNGGDLLWTKAVPAYGCSIGLGSPGFIAPDIAAGPTGDAAGMVGCQTAASTPVVVGRVNGSGLDLGSTLVSGDNHVYPNYVGIGPGNHLGVAFGGIGVGPQGVSVIGHASFQVDSAAHFTGEQIDALGNLYVLTQVESGPVTLDPSITLPANNPPSITRTWLVREGPSGPQVYANPPTSYLADGQAGVFFSGDLSSTLDLGCGPMVPSPTSSSYVARLDPTGNCLYADVFPVGVSTVADGQGGVLLAASSAAPLDLGCGTQSAAPGGSTVFARLDGAGTCVFGGSFAAPGLGFRFGPGGAVVVSGVVGAAAVDLGTGPLAPIGTQDLVIASLDPLGNLLGTRRFGAPGLTMSGSVKQAATGDVYIKTSYAGAVDFGGGPVSSVTGDVVIASLTPTGAHRWSRSLHIAGTHTMDIDGCGGLVVTSGDLSFDPGGGTFIPSMSPYQYIGFARFQP
jgi:hypothetical protein